MCLCWGERTQPRKTGGKERCRKKKQENWIDCMIIWMDGHGRKSMAYIILYYRSYIPQRCTGLWYDDGASTAVTPITAAQCCLLATITSSDLRTLTCVLPRPPSMSGLLGLLVGVPSSLWTGAASSKVPALSCTHSERFKYCMFRHVVLRKHGIKFKSGIH